MRLFACHHWNLWLARHSVVSTVRSVTFRFLLLLHLFSHTGVTTHCTKQ